MAHFSPSSCATVLRSPRRSPARIRSATSSRPARVAYNARATHYSRAPRYCQADSRARPPARRRVLSAPVPVAPRSFPRVWPLPAPLERYGVTMGIAQRPVTAAQAQSQPQSTSLRLRLIASKEHIAFGKLPFELSAIAFQLSLVDIQYIPVIATRFHRAGKGTPVAQSEIDENDASKQQADGDKPCQQRETLPRRRPDNLLAITPDKILDDLLLGFALLQLLANDPAHLLGQQRRRVGNRFALADGTF